MDIVRYRKVPMGVFENTDDLPGTLHRTDRDGWWHYRPREKAPLRFIRSDREVIQPAAFHTDLGTIPKLFRIGRLLQPEALPAVALTHDWIVRQKNCNESTRSFADSIRVQQEALKTWMETHPKDRSQIVFYLTRIALGTRRSRAGWCHRFETCPPTLDEIIAAQRSLGCRLRKIE
jgi:hypothetical protein